MMEPAEERFARRLPEYLTALEGTSHDARRIHFLSLVRDCFGVDLTQAEIEVGSSSGRGYRGRIDTLLGDLVFEFKRSLDRELEDAKTQLSGYITDLRMQHPTRSYTGVATDGVRIVAFAPEYDWRGQVTALRTIGERDLALGVRDTASLYLWLDSLLESFRERRPATTQSVVAGLGPASAAFRTAMGTLARLYRALGDSPALQLRVGQWRHYLSLVYGEETGDTDLFLKHTYLATVARLLALLRLGSPFLPTLEELGRIVRGSYFEEQTSLANFIEDDFFTWLLLEPSRLEGLTLALRLLNTLQTYDFSQVREDVLKELYQGLVDPEARHDLGEYYTPDWLAELMLRDELRLPEDPRRSLLDPACGSGTFLFIAVRLVRQALEQEGMAASDILAHILDNVVGMDVHPLAVTISRTNYLLALGNLLEGPHPKVTVPVYLADSIRLPETTRALGERGSYAIQTTEPNVFLQVPESLATNPAGLDYLLPFMKDRYGRSILRYLRDENSPEAQRAWEDFHQLLVSPETSPKLFALDEADATTIMETQRVLVRFMVEEKDTLWFFILRNSLRPAYLARQKFDLVVGNPPWLSRRYVRNPRYARWVRDQILKDYRLVEEPGAGRTYIYSQMELATLFFARAADLYLRDGGTIAFVMPRSVMVAQQHARFTGMSFKEGGLLTLGLRKVLDLEGVSPLFNVPACVLVAEKGKWPECPVPGAVVSGDLVVKNRSLAEARPLLATHPTAYQRVEGRLVAEGSLSPLTLSLSKGMSGARGRSYYYDKFYQGAIIVPRNFWFVRLVAGPLGFDQAAPYFETDPEGTRQAKVPWKDVRMAGNVEARFLYATLPSGSLAPFGYTRLSPVILPLIEEGGQYTLLNPEAAQDRGFYHLTEWLRKVQEHWQVRAKSDEAGQLRYPSIVRRLDYLHNLTRQSPQRRYRVLYNAAGTNLCAAVIDTGNLAPSTTPEQVPLAGYLTDHELYFCETDSADEARYIVALFNAPTVDALLKPTQTRGLWGERHIHKRPLQFPIPQFDPENANHVRLAELGQRCAERVREVMPELAGRYRSIGRLRGEVRRLLSAELTEIDALARQVLGVD